MVAGLPLGHLQGFAWGCVKRRSQNREIELEEQAEGDRLVRDVSMVFNAQAKLVPSSLDPTLQGLHVADGPVADFVAAV